MISEKKLETKSEDLDLSTYVITPVVTMMTIIAGISNQGMSGFWFAAPSAFVAALILVDKDKTEHLISKKIIIVGLVIAAYVGISRIQGGRLFYPSNGKELVVNETLCFYTAGYDLNVFSKFESVEKCNDQAKAYRNGQGNILEKGEKVKVRNVETSNYFWGINHYAQMSTKYGVGSYSEGEYDKGFFLVDGKTFTDSDIANPYLLILACLMFFPFFLLSPYLYYKLHKYLHSP